MGIILWILRSLASAALGIAIFVAFLVFLVAYIVSSQLLNPQFYSRALTEQDAYNRVYDDVLLDSGHQLLAQYYLGDRDLVTYRELVQVARQVAPPEYLQQQTEGAIEGATDYLSGKDEGLESYLDAGPVLDKVKPALLELLDHKIDALPLWVPDPAKPQQLQLLEFSAAVQTFFSDLAEGRIPKAVPDVRVVPGPLRGAAFDGFMAELTSGQGLDPHVALALRLAAPDLRREFVAGNSYATAKLAVRAAAGVIIDDAIAAARARLDSQSRLDLADLASRTEIAPGKTWLDQLQEVRQRLAVLPVIRWAALAVVALAVLLMGLVHLPRPVPALGWPGLTLLLTGGVCLGAGQLASQAGTRTLGHLMDSWVEQAAGVPPSVADLVGDVLRALIHDAARSAIGPSLVLMLCGILLLALALVLFLIKRRRTSY